jgi:Lysyl oxidase
MRTRTLIAGAALVLALPVVVWAIPARAAADRLPNLRMAPLTDLRVDKTADGRRLLRFSMTIVNVGTGGFEVHATRADSTATSWMVGQRIYDDAGGSREATTSTQLVFGGDGHNHWHIRDLESAELIRLDNGVKVGTSAKRGFCFWDNVRFLTSLPGSPPNGFYGPSGCGTSPSTQVDMGLSVGWGDEYPATLPDQNIDITGLTAGRYRLQVTADTGGQFLESNDADNSTWLDLQIKGNGQPHVVGRGPSA